MINVSIQKIHQLYEDTLELLYCAQSTAEYDLRDGVLSLNSSVAQTQGFKHINMIGAASSIW